MTKIVAVKIRSSIDASRSISDTIESLELESNNSVRIMENSDSNRGMLEKVKDYVAYGEVEEDTAEKIGQEGETVQKSPPSGGFKSIKRQYHQGGSLGERDDMEELVERMV